MGSLDMVDRERLEDRLLLRGSNLSRRALRIAIVIDHDQVHRRRSPEFSARTSTETAVVV